MKGVRVLKFVDEDVIESSSDFGRNGGFLHGVTPVKQEIIIVEHIVSLLSNDVCAEQLFEFIDPVGAPREDCVERSREFAASIDLCE